MPGKVKVKVLAGRNLPVMDKGSDTTDAYVEIKLGNITHKTDVCRKSLNPQWNSTEWYRFEVDDAELQDEPLQLRLMDHDTYSANDAIGKVYISLNPLLLPEAQQCPPNAAPAIPLAGKDAVMSGWIPVFDTMHGIRGEVNVIVKVELFNDFNKFRQSSCGVQFFHSPIIPYGYQAQVIHGFVEELVINDDPEYQWIDKIRTPRASNEARQVAFLKLSGQVQRKIGLKALELGANAVIGFRRCLDLEGDVGVVARGIGTAVTLVRQQEQQNLSTNGNLATSPDNLAQHFKQYINFLNTESEDQSDPNSTSNRSNEKLTSILNVLTTNSETNNTQDQPAVPKHSASLGTELFTTRPTHEWRQYKTMSDINVFHGKSSQSLKDGAFEVSPIKHLLDQEDSRHNMKNSLTRSLKNFKSSSQNLLSKKMSAMKSKRLDDDDASDKMSLKSYSSEKSLKIQFSDLKNEIKRKTRFKKSGIKRSLSGDEGGDMAALLVRSVMHVHSSLDCIKETHENNSPLSTLRRPSKVLTSTDSTPEIEQSAPNLAIIIDPVQEFQEMAEDFSTSTEKMQSFSLDNVSIHSDNVIDKRDKLLNIRKNKRLVESCPTTPQDIGKSDFFLKIPSEENLYGSSNICSSDDYSSSDDDNSEDTSMRDSVSNCNLETVSLIVKSVLEQKKVKDEEVSDYSDEYLNNLLKFDNLHQTISPLDIDVSAFQMNTMPSEIVHEHEKISSLRRSQDSLNKENFHSDTSTSGETACLSQILTATTLTTADLDRDLHHNVTTGHPTSTADHKHHNIFDTAFKKVLKEKLHFKGFHSHSTSPSSATMSPSSDSKKSKFHFPNNLFRRHVSETGTSGGIFGHKMPTLSPTSKKKKMRTFSAGEGDLKPGLITTAIQTMLMEKINVMGEIISHEPIVGDEEHMRRRFSSLDTSNFISNERYFSMSHEGINRTAEYKETKASHQTSVLSRSLTDISNIGGNASQRKREPDLLSLPRETVLGSLFMSLNDVKNFENERKHYLSASSGFSSHSSLHRPYLIDDNEHTKYENVHVVDDELNKHETKEYQEENIHSAHMLDTREHITGERTYPHSINDDFNENLICENIIECDESSVNPEAFEEDTELKKGIYDQNVDNIRSPKSKVDHNELAKYRMPTNRGNSLTAGVCGGAVLRPSMNQESIDMLEYPFLTLTKFPPGFIMHIGGAVAARSVKLLERVPNPEEPAPRDAWWSELRTEVRSHMRALRCNAVLAYQETTAICDDVCVLSATGTAAVIDLHPNSLLAHSGPPSVSKNQSNANGNRIGDEPHPHGELIQTSSLDRTDFEKTEPANNPKQNIDNNVRRKGGGGERCGPCHVPYNSSSMPYRVSVTKCALCRKGRVPSVVLCSLEPPEGLATIGRGCLLQAAITRARTPARGEPAARDISDQLPFLEYELHRLLLAKLRVRGMNAIFGLRTSIAVGANLVAAVGVGTAVLLAALGPGCGGPKVRAGPGDPEVLESLQRGLDEALQANKNIYQLHTEQELNGKQIIPSDTDDSEDEIPDIELSAGNKDTCVLEVDDAEDLEVLRNLTEPRPPAGLHVVNTQSVPGLLGCEGLVSVRNLQMFTQLWRARLANPPGLLQKHFQRLLQNVYFKLRRMVPCAICDLRFRLDLPEADEIQLVVTGMAVGLGEPPPELKKLPDPSQNSGDVAPKAKEGAGGDINRNDSSDMIFALEEEHISEVNGIPKNCLPAINLQLSTLNGGLFGSSGIAWQSGVDMTPLAGVPGARVLRYLGNLDYIFVRESTSIREHGGLSGFLHGFITEVMAVIRAHVTALGGNAIVAFYMTELILSDNPHKNQAQCLVSVGGDVVFVSYFQAE